MRYMNRGKKKILVTGASGFLGSHICDALHEAGYDVHAFIRPSSSRQWLGHDRLTLHVANFNDSEALSKTLEGVDVVIHAAAALIGASDKELHEVNAGFTSWLAGIAVSQGVKKFVFVSSNSADGPTRTIFPKKESDEDFPLSPYGKSKKEAELELEKFKDRIKIINLRYVLMYGPRDRHVLRLFELVKSPIVPLVGTRPVYMSLLYATDAARAAVAAVEADVPSGSIYSVSDGLHYTHEMFYEFIATALGKKLRVVRIPVRLSSFITVFLVAGRRKDVSLTPREVSELRHRFRLVSIEKTIKDLKWQPKVPLHEGVVETVRWYKETGWLK